MSRLVRCLCLLLACVTLLTVAAGCNSNSRSGASSSAGKTVEDMLGTDTEQDPFYFNGVPYVLNPDVSAYLFIGVDKSGEVQEEEGFNVGGQADVLLLAVINDADKTYHILQLNRDTMAEIRVLSMTGNPMNTFTGQLALSHYYGSGFEDSCENTVWSVSKFLYDAPIDGYISLRMDAIPVLNDWAGGVTVTIQDDFSSIDPSLKIGETITLNGQQAYNFIRSRQNVEDQSNLNRMARHRQYLSGLAQQLKTKVGDNAASVAELYQLLEPYMVTDMGSGTITQLAERCRGYTDGGTITLEGEAVKGEQFMEFHVDEQNLRETVIQLFYTEYTQTEQGE